MMQLILRTKEGKEVRIEVLPTDTFQDLSYRLLDHSKIVVDLSQLTIKGKHVNAMTDNVIEYFNDYKGDKADSNTIASSSNVENEKVKTVIELDQSGLETNDACQAANNNQPIHCKENNKKHSIDPDDEISNELMERFALKSNNAQNTDGELLVCRFCTLEFKSSKMINLFKESSKDGIMSLADVINYNLPIFITKEDRLPNHICLTCFAEFAKQNRFVDKIVSSEVTLETTWKNPKFSREKCHNCPRCADGKMIEYEDDDVDEVNETYSSQQLVEQSIKSAGSKTNKRVLNDISEDADSLNNIVLTDVHSLSDKRNGNYKKKIITDDEDLTEYSEIVPVRKRGRQNEAIESTGDVDEYYSTYNENQPRRRRGRPKGSYKKPVIKEESKCSVQCNICLMMFPDIPDILEHTLINHCDENISELPCPLCSSFFLDEGDLIEHVNNHSTRVKETVYPCGLCDSICKKKSELENHLLQDHIKTTPRIYRCHHCEIRFDSSYDLVIHLSHFHTCGASTEVWECPSCNEQYEQKEEFMHHYTTVHICTDGSIYACPVCDEQICSSKDLIEHLMEVHCETRTVEKPLFYQCVACNGKFGTQYNFIKHQCPMIDPGLTCFDCNIKFPIKARYVLHILLHGENHLMKCDVCLADFTDECNFYDHIRFQHEGVKNSSCDVCNKTFKNGSSLKLHMRTHEDIRNHKCEVKIS